MRLWTWDGETRVPLPGSSGRFNVPDFQPVEITDKMVNDAAWAIAIHGDPEIDEPCAWDLEAARAALEAVFSS